MHDCFRKDRLQRSALPHFGNRPRLDIAFWSRPLCHYANWGAGSSTSSGTCIVYRGCTAVCSYILSRAHSTPHFIISTAAQRNRFSGSNWYQFVLKLATAAQQWPLDLLRFLEPGLPGTRISWTSRNPEFPELKIIFEMTPPARLRRGHFPTPFPVALAAHVLSFFVPPTTPSDEQRRSPLNICF